MSVDSEQVQQILGEVIDPELGINIVDLGMLQEVEIEGGRVEVSLGLTSMSCPFWELFSEQVGAAVRTVEGVEEVVVHFDRGKPWSPDLMTDEARQSLESVGLMPPRFRQPCAGQPAHSQLISLMPATLARVAENGGED
jgi:metal-sulfur cluster biosynthetic enzyme